MGNEKAVSGNTIPLHPRPITRALARASSNLTTSSEVAATSTTLINNQGRVLRANSKRTASDDKNANAPKRRAVLNDITNVSCENNIQVVIYTTILLPNIDNFFLLTSGEYQTDKEGKGKFFQGYKRKGTSCVYRHKRSIFL